MNKSLSSTYCFTHAVLLTLSSSNLVFLEVLGVFSSIVTTTSVGILFILLILTSQNFRIQKGDIGYLILLVGMILTSLIGLFPNMSSGNFLYAMRDSIWLIFSISILFFEVNIRYFVGLTKNVTLLMLLGLGVVVFLSWYLGISLQDVNIDVYKDVNQAFMMNMSTLTDQFRFTLPGLNSNTTGTILLVSFLMIFCLLRGQDNKLYPRIYYLILLIFSFFFLATFSKTVLVLLVVSGGLMVFSGLIKPTKFILFLVSSVLVVWIVEPLVIYRFIALYDILTGSDLSNEFVARTSERSNSVSTSWELIVSNPFGISFESYDEIARNSFGGGEHNNYLYLTIIYGIPFGILYFTYFLLVASKSFISYKQQAKLFDPYSTRLSTLSFIIAVCILLVQFVAPTPVYALILSSLCLLINKTVANERALSSNHLQLTN